MIQFIVALAILGQPVDRPPQAPPVELPPQAPEVEIVPVYKLVPVYERHANGQFTAEYKWVPVTPPGSYSTQINADGFLAYSEATYKAVSENKPMVVFVGMQPRKITGMVCSYREKMIGFQGAGVAVFTPDGKGWLRWAQTLSPNATDADIRREAGLTRSEVSQSATPFPVVTQRDIQGSADCAT